MELTSRAFTHNGKIPSKYTCDGDRSISPPLTLQNVPPEAQSLALVMDDPDIPEEKKRERGVDVFDHWVVYNITPPPAGGTAEIEEGSLVGQRGLTSRGEAAYTGPCPPPEYEPKEHRYFFRAYALSDILSFDSPPTKDELLRAMEPLLIAQAELMGRYQRTVE